MNKQWLTKFIDTKWHGNGELWLDAEGNSTEHYKCDLQVTSNAIHYSWEYEQKKNTGSFTFDDTGAVWVDTWHQPELADCINMADSWALFAIIHHYKVPSNPNWGWISRLSERPDGALVLQMTNLTPWGEEGRAVRMIFSCE